MKWFVLSYEKNLIFLMNMISWFSTGFPNWYHMVFSPVRNTYLSEKQKWISGITWVNVITTSDVRALVFWASSGLKPCIFWTFRALGFLRYQHFGLGRVLSLCKFQIFIFGEWIIFDFFFWFSTFIHLVATKHFWNPNLKIPRIVLFSWSWSHEYYL